MRHLITYLFIVFITLNCTSQKDSSSNQSRHLKAAIETNEAIGLDVRTKKEVQENAAPGAKNIPIDTLSQRMNELDKDKKILVFCESGGRASMAKEQLEKNGFQKVVNIKDWRVWREITKDKK